MARPRSKEKQTAILTATSSLIARHGLTGTPTALIAQKAKVSEGTIFHYFSSKENLLNQVYIHLKQQVNSRLEQIDRGNRDFKDYLSSIWTAYIQWGCDNPEDSKALNHIVNSGLISAETQQELEQLLPISRRDLVRETEGSCPEEEEFTEALFLSLAATTITFAVRHPDRRTAYSQKGFAVLWQAYSS